MEQNILNGLSFLRLFLWVNNLQLRKVEKCAILSIITLYLMVVYMVTSIRGDDANAEEDDNDD